MNTATNTAVRNESPREDLLEQEQLLIRKSIELLSSGMEPFKAIREMLHLLSERLGLDRGRLMMRGVSAMKKPGHAPAFSLRCPDATGRCVGNRLSRS